MIVHLVIWFIFSFGVHWFAPQLNKLSFIGMPLGFYMAAQGSLIVFVVQLFVFVRQQHNVDVRFGMAEEE
jgi:putative solute:sodium symporter small subunit